MFAKKVIIAMFLALFAFAILTSAQSEIPDSVRDKADEMAEATQVEVKFCTNEDGDVYHVGYGPDVTALSGTTYYYGGEGDLLGTNSWTDVVKPSEEGVVRLNDSDNDSGGDDVNKDSEEPPVDLDDYDCETVAVVEKGSELGQKSVDSCPIPSCSPAPEGCEYVDSDVKKGDGCPKQPCGKLKCDDGKDLPVSVEEKFEGLKENASNYEVGSAFVFKCTRDGQRVYSVGVSSGLSGTNFYYDLGGDFIESSRTTDVHDKDANETVSKNCERLEFFEPKEEGQVEEEEVKQDKNEDNGSGREEESVPENPVERDSRKDEGSASGNVVKIVVDWLKSLF